MSQTQSLSLGTVHAAISRLSSLRANMLALVCGIITIFAFAPFHFWPIYIVSLSLLVWLIDGARLKDKWRWSVFLKGWLFGVGFTFSGMHWMAAPFLVEPEKHIYFIWMPLVLLPAGLGLFFGLASVLAGMFWSRTPGRIFSLVIAFSVTEWLRSHLFGGFPWNLPGTIWEPGGAFSQLASLVGVFGLSMLTLLLATAPAALADFRIKGSAFSRIIPALLCVFVFGLGWGWGSQRLNTQITSADVLSVRLVDVEINQKDKYPSDPDEYQSNLRDILISYLTATGDDFPDEPRLVIWPEAALPIPLLQDPNALDAVTARLGERTLITGTARVDHYAQPVPKWYNSLAILTKNSNKRGALAIYDKHRLVPFGEMAAADFIPFGHSVGAILPNALQRLATSGFQPGTPPRPLELPSGEKFLPLICYEAMFPELVRENLDDAELLINISIDSWFGGGIGPEQHFVQSAYRSIETGKPLIRVANLGVSTYVDPFGRASNESKVETKPSKWSVKTKDLSVSKVNLNTTYGSVGDAIYFIILILFVLFGIVLTRSHS